VPTLGGVPEIIVSPVFDEEGFDPERKQASGFLRLLSIARNAL
jgi:hypothetical protein